MGEIVSLNNASTPEAIRGTNELVALTDSLLMDARTAINSNDSNKVLSVPIAELSTLGAGVSSLIPAFNTVTQTISIGTDGLFRIANAAAGDTLKMAKNGNAWGSMKTSMGASKLVQLTEAGPLSATTQAVAAFNPATMMMAVALYSIEKALAEIVEALKKILNFLEVENESQIEADVESLLKIAVDYKYSWDNELSVASSHKLAIDIQNRARKNMISYQKKISDTVSSKQLVVAQNMVKSTLYALEKQFKYYRLSLYTFSLASFMEIMLSGNFKEEYIASVKDEISALSDAYRTQFEKGSLYLERLSNSDVEAKVVKGIGSASIAVGKLIGSIPLVKEGPVEEFLQDKGAHLQDDAVGLEQDAVKAFAAVNNPGTRIFMDKMEDMIQIYNHTSQICFDSERIYLLA